MTFRAATRVEDVCSRALDLIGAPVSIADIEDGSKQSQVALRHYGPALRQLHRSAHWNFTRRRAVLTLLQDATGQTAQQQQAAGLPVTVGNGTHNMPPWTYEYAWPIDCVRARFVPMTLQTHPNPPAGSIAIPANPLMSGLSQAPFHRQVPTRFVVGTDAVPNLVGTPPSWEYPDTSTTMGQGIASQTVILSNQQNAHLVYTTLITYPDQWDPLFSQAFVALLGSYFAMQLVPDRKEAVRVRDDMVKICHMALDQARVTDGDEMWGNVDHVPDWLRVRNSGTWGGTGFGQEAGVLSYGYESLVCGDGSSY